MQIPNVNLVASLSAISGKLSAEPTAMTESASNLPQSQIEQSNESNADRDAQGQGDGLNRPRAGKQPNPNSHQHSSDLAASANELANTAPSLPDEPPSQLDLIG